MPNCLRIGCTNREQRKATEIDMAILSNSDIERIHEESLRVLAETGVQVDDDAVIRLLLEHGCSPAEKPRVVRFPREVIARSLQQCPRQVKLASVSSDETVLTAGGASVYWTGNAINLAMMNDQIVPIDKERFADMVHVIDGLEHVHAIIGTCLADVPPPVRGLTGLRLLAENCVKHFRPCIFHPREAKAMIEMAQVILDGKSLRDSPILNMGYTAISPLRWSDLAIGAFRESSGHGVPMMVNAEPAGGVTAPVTLAGELVLGNAEALSGVVICQALEPGRPLVFNMGFAHILDMQTAMMRTGGIENGLLQAAGAEIAAFHGLPSAAWMNTESTMIDAGAAAEHVLTGLLHTLSHANIILGIGNLESTKCMSLEMAVIGNDIAGALRHAQKGIRVDKDTLATELIQEMGQNANYLTHEHTMRHFKQEYYYPRVFNRRPRGRWESLGSPTIIDEAHALVERLRELPVRSALSSAQRNELLTIEKNWTAELTKTC
jgi:trimethylamine---corrinoid protein Co-methyltransferase